MRNHILNSFRKIIHNAYVRYMAILVLIVCLHPSTAHTDPTDNAGSIKIILSPERIEQGSVGRITLVCPATVASVSYTLNDMSAMLMREESSVYSGFIPIAMDQKPGPATLAVTLHNADTTTSSFTTPLEIIEKDFPVQHLTIDESKNTLSTENLKRHYRERALILKMFSQSPPRKQWNQSFSAPLKGRLSTPFGVRRFINEQPRNPHSGVDIAAPLGTPIKAAADGVVSLTGEHFFAGKSVYIDHGHTIFSMYFHLDSIAVQEGNSIAKGDIIGRVGATGRATGPHLHWGMRIQDIPIDPYSLLTLFEK